MLLCMSKSLCNLAQSNFYHCSADGKLSQLLNFSLAMVIHTMGGLGPKLPQ